MSTLGSLVVTLAANTAAFQSDLGKAAREAENRLKSIGEAAQGAGKILGAALLAAAGTMTVLVKQAIDAADETGKMAQKIGLSAAALSAYQVQARLADVSNQQLQTGFQQLARNQADFSAGIGEAADAFRTLGISQEQVKSLNGDTAALFELVAGKLAKFEDGANKTALAMKIFGRSGAELIPLINSLEQTRNEAALLGAIIDKDTAEAAERFNDNMTRSKIAVQGIALAVARDLLPVLEPMSEAIVESAKGAQQFSVIGASVKTVMQTIAVVGSDVAFVFRMIGGEIGVWAAQLAALARGDFKAFSEISKQWTEDAAKARVELDAWQARIMGVGQAADATGPKIETKLVAPTLAAGNAAKEAKEAYDRFREAIMRVHDDAANAAAADQENARRAGDLLRDLIELRRKVRDGEVDYNDFNNFGVDARGAAQDWSNWTSEVERAGKAAADFGFTFNVALEDAILNGEKLGDVVRALARDIARMILRVNVTQPLADAFKGGFAGANGVGGLFGVGGLLGPEMPNSGMAFAEGTDFVPRTGLALVHQGERIIPADENRRGGGGMTINMPIHFSANTPAAVRDAVFALAPQLTRAAMAGVAEGKSRGRG